MAAACFVVDIVTGATAGIGRSIAEYIAHQRALQHQHQDDDYEKKNSSKYRLILVGRNAERGVRTAASIAKSTNLDVAFEQVNLDDWKDVSSLKERIVTSTGAQDFQVGILVNDAAECPRRQQLVERRQKQDNGEVILTLIDKQFATNVLGYHFMMRLLEDHFSSHLPTVPTKTHIVNVASNWAGDLDLNDLHFQRRHYDNDTAYRQSKQCNRMLTVSWSQRFIQDNKAVVVNSCHPGDPCTTLSQALGYNLGCAPPTRNMIETQTPIPFLTGLLENGDGGGVSTTGGWYQGTGPQQPWRCQFAHRTKEINRLHDICDSFCC